MLKKAGYLLKILVSKLKNTEGTVIVITIEIAFKYLFSSAICVGVLQLLNLLAMFGLHLINHLKNIENKDKACEIKTV